MQLVLCTVGQISLHLAGTCEWVSKSNPIMTNLTWFASKTGPIIVQMMLFLVLFWRKPLTKQEINTL